MRSMWPRNLVLGWVGLCVVCACGGVAAGQAVEAPAAPAGERGRGGPGRELPGLKITRGITYATVDGRALRLDLYGPGARAGEQPGAGWPVVVWIHGGGWEMGGRTPCAAAMLVPRGYAAVSISYRLTGEAAFPAQVHDCKGAVRWVRAHAAEYGLNGEKIGVWGASAGGHLAALLGTSAGVESLEGDVGGNAAVSSAVQAVCDWFGPTDIARLAAFDEDGGAIRRPRRPTPRVIARLLGGNLPEKAAVAREASPITHVSAGDAPVLIMHGDADRLVPLEQSELLEAALKRAGVEVTLHVVKGGGHGFAGMGLLEKIDEFFARHLKGETVEGREGKVPEKTGAQ